MWQCGCIIAMKLLALVIAAGNYVAMLMHHCHSVAIKLLVLVIAGNYEAMTASEAVEAAQS